MYLDYAIVSLTSINYSLVLLMLITVLIGIPSSKLTICFSVFKTRIACCVRNYANSFTRVYEVYKYDKLSIAVITP